jgi:multidrug transporter EmrE-like cation transporter
MTSPASGGDMKFIHPWRVSLATIAVFASMLGLVVALQGIVISGAYLFYAGSGALCGGLIAATVLPERERNRRDSAS